MEAKPQFNISDETINQIGLELSDKPINAQIAIGARIFKYPGLKDVYIMESDLYGNTMPEGSCFLVFEGKHGLIGKHLSIETLTNAKPEAVQKLIDDNSGG